MLGCSWKTNERHLEQRQKIIVEGRLIHQTYENKNGERKNRTVVEANEFMLFDPLAHNEQDQTKRRLEMNLVHLIGTIQSEPRLHELPNGRRLVKFTLVTEESYLDVKDIKSTRKIGTIFLPGGDGCRYFANGPMGHHRHRG